MQPGSRSSVWRMAPDLIRFDSTSGEAALYEYNEAHESVSDDKTMVKYMIA